jgi:hypothetical protein
LPLRVASGRLAWEAVPATGPTPEIRPAGDRAAAGATIAGRVLGLQGVIEVVLVRHERSPARDHAIACASVVLRGRHGGRYALDVPPALPPTAQGRGCAIDYTLTAKEALAKARPVVAPIVLGAAGRPHLERGPTPPDRIIPNARSRHFHLELADAELHGGGRIAGRLHRHGEWPPRAPTVELNCVESWLAFAPALAGVAHWDRAVLWHAEAAVELDPDRTWVPFAFDIPADLPPAVEGHTIAWRYELSAHRPARIGVDDYAALTPLLFETG